MDNLTVAGRAIGIDIGTHSVKVASVQHRLGTVTVEKAANVAIERGEDGAPKPDAAIEALKQAMEGIRVRKDLVVASVSTQIAAVRNLAIPFSDMAKAQAVIKFQAEPHLPFPIDDVIVDFYDTKTGTEERMDVLLTAIRKQGLREQIDIVRTTGIDPEVLEVDFMAVSNTFNKSGLDSEQGTLLIDIGASKTIVVFIKQGMPLALRSFPIGGDTITTAIAGKMNVSYQEAEELKIKKADAAAETDDDEDGLLNEAIGPVLNRFGGEIGRTLRFFNAQISGSGDYRAVLTGGGAMMKGMKEYLQDILAHEVTILPKIENLKDNTRDGFIAADFATAIGLGLRGIGETRFLHNFRQEELAFSQTYKRMRTSMYTSVALIAAIFIAYVVGLVVKVQVLDIRAGKLASQIMGEYVNALSDRPPKPDPANILTELRLEVGKKSKELQDLRGAEMISVLEVLNEMSSLIPSEMEIELKSFKIDDTIKGVRLAFDGTANTNHDIIEIQEDLEASDLFSDVSIDGIKLVRGKYSFKLKARIRGR